VNDHRYLNLAEAYHNPMRMGVELFLGFRRPGNDRREMVTNATVESLAPDEAQRDTLIITPEAAQQLAETLWAAGFKPRAAEPAHGELAAVRDHRDDLRKLVSAAYGVSIAGSR
jgi:hypothetical protein